MCSLDVHDIKCKDPFDVFQENGMSDIMTIYFQGYWQEKWSTFSALVLGTVWVVLSGRMQESSMMR